MIKKILCVILLQSIWMGFLQAPEIQAQAPLRSVLIEEFTGEWCGWCPIGMMELENLAEKYGDTLIIVAVHTSDPLETASASGMIGVWAGFAPSAIINRTYDTILGTQIFEVDSWDEVIARQINTPSPCNVQVTYTYNDVSREISATVTASFTESYIGDARLNVYIVEDSVIGDSQSNYLSGDPAFINTPFYSLPEYIPGFAHQHVLREMLGESSGIDGIIPDTVFAGQQFQHTFTFTFPGDYNIDKLHIIGVAQQYKGLKKYRIILNSTHQKFDPEFTGLQEYSQAADLIIHPMPAANFINLKTLNNQVIQKVQFFSIEGKQIYSGNTRDAEIHFDLNSFPNGCFIVRVQTNENIYLKKIIINK
jgi:thiol-disulfide isomerase/thioredoxin